MIEESVLENERRGGFTRVYPNDMHVHLYRNFFEEERRNDNVLHSYIFTRKYKNMTVDTDNLPISALDYEGMRSMKNNRPSRGPSGATSAQGMSHLNTDRKQNYEQFVSSPP